MLKYALFSLFFSWSLHGYQQELLKPSDIQQIMTQILDQHLGDKAMTKELLKSSVRPRSQLLAAKRSSSFSFSF